jgi:AcrR family transcriptional regulator
MAGSDGDEPAPARRRRSATEARERILDAAERTLVRVGPEGLRLKELAAELELSHPAILHHFGSREGLIHAVIERSIGHLQATVLGSLAALSDPDVEVGAILDAVFEVLGDRGQARLLAWMIVSGHTQTWAESPVLGQRPVWRLAEAVHARRVLDHPDAPFEDTRFALELAALTLLADALFGDRMRAPRTGAGEPRGAGADEGAGRRFREWLAKLLVRHLDAPP